MADEPVIEAATNLAMAMPRLANRAANRVAGPTFAQGVRAI